MIKRKDVIEVVEVVWDPLTSYYLEVLWDASEDSEYCVHSRWQVEGIEVECEICPRKVIQSACEALISYDDLVKFAVNFLKFDKSEETYPFDSWWKIHVTAISTAKV